MLGLRRSLLLVGYLFTTVHVLVLLSRYARPEARPELASYPGSIEASPEPEDHVPSDLHCESHFVSVSHCVCIINIIMYLKISVLRVLYMHEPLACLKTAAGVPLC